MKNIIIFFLMVIPFLTSSTVFCQSECTSKIRFDGKKVAYSEEEWKQRLTPEQFIVLREGEMEKSYKSEAYRQDKKGMYLCAGCMLSLFSSKTKFDAKNGWPTFYAPICPQNLAYREKRVWLWKRTQVLCNRCEGFLGEVSEDPVQPSGKRYTINGAALVFHAN